VGKNYHLEKERLRVQNYYDDLRLANGFASEPWFRSKLLCISLPLAYLPPSFCRIGVAAFGQCLWTQFEQIRKKNLKMREKIAIFEGT